MEGCIISHNWGCECLGQNVESLRRQDSFLLASVSIVVGSLNLGRPNRLFIFLVHHVNY